MSFNVSASSTLPLSSSTVRPGWPPGWGARSAWLAALAVLLPTLVALHEPPSVTYYNQALAVLGWGVWLWWLGRCWMGRAPHTPGTMRPLIPLSALSALWLALALQAAAALWACLHGPLPLGLGLMGAGLPMVAGLAMLAGCWSGGDEPGARASRSAFFTALMLAGAVGLLIALIQVFMPGWTDGNVLARPTVPGRAVGNLRQPNHFSSLLVMAAAAAVWLGAQGLRSPRWMAALVAGCIAGVVLTASRTGMVAMALLALWGLLDRSLPGRWRVLLLSSPLLYGMAWLAMAGLSQLHLGVAFAAEARLHDGSDVSSSRFAIWANTLSLIAQHPWQGVGFGGFNAAWTFTPFPDRPRAFFDHTHNLPLHWAVELGLPLAVWLTALCAWAWWALVRRLWRAPAVQAPTVGACALMVTTLGLHSLLEYPLWYAHLLLPTAFAWGLGLGSASATASQDGDPSATLRRGAWVLMVGGVATAVAAVWNMVDYRLAADIYAPWTRQVPLAQRIATSQAQPWWGHQADYAAVTSKRLPTPQPADFSRTLMNLIDARLMMAYARALAASGDVDRARAVADRLREFHNPAAIAFFDECKVDEAAAAKPVMPFQCQPAQRTYRWDQLLPSSRRQ